MGGALGASRRAGPARDRRPGSVHRFFWGSRCGFLLAGRVAWRRLLPCAVATGVFFVGMLAVFSVILSGMVISYTQKYRPIGTVFGLMSWLIASGVVIILGATVGLVWQERGLSFRAALPQSSAGPVTGGTSPEPGTAQPGGPSCGPWHPSPSW